MKSQELALIKIGIEPDLPAKLLEDLERVEIESPRSPNPKRRVSCLKNSVSKTVEVQVHSEL